jgi:predicted ArsR family transcriptional regulator
VGPGRPADVYSLSDAGRKLFAHGVDEFARLLLREVAETDGPGKLHAMLERVHQRMADSLKEEVGEGPPREQLKRMAKVLRKQGTIADVSRGRGETRLKVFTCPYHGVVEGAGEFCEIERETLSKLTGGEVRLGRRLVDGQACCEFKISSSPEGGDG